MAAAVVVADTVAVDGVVAVEADEVVEVSSTLLFFDPPFHQLMGLTKDVGRRFHLF
jgi:hypothetical protein